MLKLREDKAKIILLEFGPEKIKRFIRLPYVIKRCDEFERSLKELINIEKFFPFKNNVKSLKGKSMVVYSLKCDTCNAEYVGKTERILYQRINEHEKQIASFNFKSKNY